MSRSRRSIRWAPWIGAGIVVFLMLDVWLVYLAVTPSASSTASSPTFIGEQTSTPSPAISQTTAPTPTPAPTAVATPSASPAPSPSATSTPSFSGFANGTVGYRATSGSCSGSGAVIERTLDGGATWQNVNPTDITIREVQSMIVVDDRHVDLLARYGNGCVLSDISTYTQGEFWQVYPDRTSTFPIGG
jgi:hypothetical protein